MSGRKQGSPRNAPGPSPRAKSGSRTQPPRRPNRDGTRGRGRRNQPLPTRPLEPLSRTDLWVAGAVAAAASLVFVSTFSGHVALGDSPETVTGVRSLGILHAPGYVTYAVAARAFSEIVRVGDWPFRVNLFSLVCAALTTAVVYLLARGFGANKAGAALGALALATTASFWFNAGFAKYYVFSALLVAVMALCVRLWQQRGGTAYLVVAGVLLGSSVGVSWQLALIVAAGLTAMVALGTRRVSIRVVLVVAVTAVVSAIAVCAYIMWRAGQDPTMNYGNATTFSRLIELLTTRDYQGNRKQAGAGFGHFAGGSTAYVAIIARDVGLGAVLLAMVGGFDVYDRRRLDHGAFVAIVGLGNIVAVGVVSGFDHISGFYTGLVMGGQLVATLVIVALLAALGATRIVYELEEWQSELRSEKSGSRFAPGRLGAAAVGVMALAVVLPSLLVHYNDANHRMPPLADRYAQRVLALLPQHSVFVTGGWEFGQPIVERQRIHGDRPDVTVLAADSIPFRWYRDQMTHRLGLDPELEKDVSANRVTVWLNAIRKTRPVYVDTYAMLYGAADFGYEPGGLVAKVVDGTGPQLNPTFETAAVALRRTEDQDDLATQKYARFPNNALYFFYERAHVELAKEWALKDDLDHAATELERALVFGPKGEDRSPIEAARKHQANAKQIILNL